MEDRNDKRRRRGGSLVFPLLLIVLGVLFLLDNLNITSGIDWDTIWKLWPVLLIAIGLEVILGRRVSFGAILVIVLIVIFGGAAVWWSVVVDNGERTTEHFSWEMNDVERAELDLDLGVGELRLVGQGDMADLMVADLELAPGVDVNQDLQTSGDVARGWVSSDRDFFFLPGLFGDGSNEWDLRLNSRVRWEIQVDSGVGDVRLDLEELNVSDLRLNAGVGSVDLILPRRGTVQAQIDGGVGDLRITIPEGRPARFRVDRGLSDLTVSGRFKRRGDYYETEDFSTAEGYIDLEIDLGVGSVTVH